MMPHSWHWWMCSLVVPSCWAWVIGLKSSLMREMRTEGSFSSFFSPFFFFFPCLCLLFLCYFLLSKGGTQLILLSLILFLTLPVILLVYDVLTICSPLRLSYPLSGNFCYLDASYLQLHPSLVVMLLTYLCKMLIHCFLLCLECYKILIFCC